MNKRPFQWDFLRRLAAWGKASAFLTTMSMSALLAADIPVDSTNDSGTGSLRSGLAGSSAGDNLIFQSSLDGTTLSGASSLSVTNAVTYKDAAAITVTDSHAYLLAAPLTLDWAGSLIFSGNLSSSSNAGSLINSGTGTLILLNANSFTGGTTLNGGTVQISNSGALGTGGITTQTAASTLALTNSLTVSNTIKLGTTLNVDVASGKSSTLSGVISGTGPLNHIGAGELFLTGTNTFTGGFISTGTGTVTLQNSSALGTGVFTVSNASTLNVVGGLSIGNEISLDANLTANVSSGSVTLSGNITENAAGTVLIKTGSGTLILTGTNSYINTGGITISGGTLQGDTTSLNGNIANSGTLIFNQRATGTYSAGNTISGTGSMIVNSTTGVGVLSFEGTNTSGTTTIINSGELQLAGGASFAGPIEIASNSGILSGTGIGVGNVTNSGFVQPGTSATTGTLTVNGTYEQLAAGTTQIKLQTPGTPENDHVTSTGAASLSGNLKIRLPDGGGAFAGTPYGFLHASSVTGQFALASSSDPAYGVVLNYGPTDVNFTLQATTPLSEAAVTTNETAVAQAIDTITSSGTATGDLYALLNTLGIQSKPDQKLSLSQMSGEVFGNMQMLALQSGDQFQQRVTSRLISNAGLLVGGPSSDNTEIRGQSSDYDSISGWGQGYGVSGHLRGDGNGSSVRYTQGGGLYSIDWGDEIDRVGIVGGNSYSRMTDGSSANGQLTSYQLGTYLLTQNDWAYFLGTANYGLNNNATNRTVTIATTTQTLHAGFNGDQIGTSFETGLKLQFGPVHVLPLFGMQYLFVGQRTTDEVGGALALHIAREQAHSLRANLGARVAMEQFVGFGGILWTPYLHGRLVSEMLDNDRIVNSSFNGVTTGGAFTTQGTGLGYHYGIFGVGSEVILNATWSLIGGAEITTSDRFTAATGSLAAVMTFW